MIGFDALDMTGNTGSCFPEVATHVLPGDALPLVLLLLLLQHELNEELLQLLVAVVDAELLKAAGQGIH